MRNFKRSYLLWLIPVLLVLLVLVPEFLPAYIAIILISVFMYVILGVSWTSFCGPTDYISLATASFFGVGVYTSAILQVLPLPTRILIGGLLSVVLGYLVGLTTLRLKGMYFCIFTFGLSELFRNTMVWYEVNIVATVGRWLPMLDHVTVYYYMLGLLVLAILAAFLLVRSRWGLALQSIGQAEDAAAHVGINVNMVKINVFALSCFFIGATGVIMSTRWSYIDPNLAFDPFVTFFTVMMVLVGGWRYTFWGPIIGATTLTLISDTVLVELPEVTMLLFGSLLVLVILFMPNGLMGLIARRLKRSSSTETVKV